MAAVDAKHEPELARWRGAMLPGTMIDGPGARRSLRDWAVDVLVTLVALGLGIIALHDSWPNQGTVFKVLDLALGTASLAALWDRRRHPVGVAAFVLAVSAISSLAAGASLAVLFNAAVRCPRRTLAWTTAGAFAATCVYAVLYATSYADGRDNVLIGGLLIGVAVGWGLFVRVRRDLVLSLHERALRLEQEGELRADGARAAERERIAREMHDVLAHRLSLLSLHAGALEFRPGAPAAEVEATARVVRESATAALEELRDVVGVLREGTEAETRRPQPTLADLPGLIEESRAAGMRIEAELDLPAEIDGAAPAGIGRTAFRVVQEGLTNCAKHAPGALVRVRVGRGEGTLEVEVRNRAPLAPVATPALPGAGSGLIGLGERVELVGGELRHEVAADGDFILAASLPWERPAR